MLTLADMKPCKRGHTNRYVSGACAGRCATCARERSAAWKKNNRDAWLANCRKHVESNRSRSQRYRRLNGDKLKQYFSEYSRSNREIVREASRRRKARVRGATLDDSVKKWWPAIVKAYRGLCCYCGSVFEHMDHVVSLKNGGAHVAGNVRPACAKCNLTKRAQTWTPRPWAAALLSEVA